MKWYKIMNNEMVIYPVMEDYITGNWELTFISLNIDSLTLVEMSFFYNVHIGWRLFTM